MGHGTADKFFFEKNVALDLWKTDVPDFALWERSLREDFMKVLEMNQSINICSEVVRREMHHRMRRIFNWASMEKTRIILEVNGCTLIAAEVCVFEVGCE